MLVSYSKQELYGNAKLTPADVRAIRARGAAGERPRELAREYLVAPETIRKVLRWDTYTMVRELEHVSPSTEEVAASQERLLAKLQEDIARARRPESLLEELLKERSQK